jgi:hypothetical protein
VAASTAPVVHPSILRQHKSPPSPPTPLVQPLPFISSIRPIRRRRCSSSPAGSGRDRFVACPCPVHHQNPHIGSFLDGGRGWGAPFLSPSFSSLPALAPPVMAFTSSLPANKNDRARQPAIIGMGGSGNNYGFWGSGGRQLQQQVGPSNCQQQSRGGGEADRFASE